MRKVIAALNMTLDGYCDHTAVSPDAEVHDHYTQLLNKAGVLLYGRKTYELMKFWQGLLQEPSGEQSMDDFAVSIDWIPKIVFSTTISNTEWESATVANKSLEEMVLELKQQSGADIFIGSRSLIVQLLNLNLLDEFQLMLHPVIAGGGLPLFEDIKESMQLKLSNTKQFASGAVILYFELKK
jgi:dihydrofolate reductase